MEFDLAMTWQFRWVSMDIFQGYTFSSLESVEVMYLLHFFDFGDGPSFLFSTNGTHHMNTGPSMSFLALTYFATSNGLDSLRSFNEI
mmetsp:Transcript_2000/g.2726  ORF Transcript_2000/g.2726 Transcript_2000/m.2726 type:complete len:87 (-) Transcript_2000:3356-3616(-)